MRFESSGDRFFMAMEEKVMMHDAEDARLLFELEYQKRVLCAVPTKICALFVFYCDSWSSLVDDDVNFRGYGT